MKVFNDIKRATIIKLLVLIVFFVFNTIAVFSGDSSTTDDSVIATNDVEADLD
ncbi:hypothetical protein [Psychroserpens luteus]|jgi:hypothetical protein|uniref:Uncharacterized protein n=1 Tax=Psychroserpens luteus TaxID=1434066 RepID=A0ABW5ZT42_9FLAO|nr:hypothetical protein [Psychroserpens luteus]